MTVKLSRFEVTHGAISILGRESIKDIVLQNCRATSPFAYLADNPWQMAPKSHWQQDCQETINHPPKVWAAKIIWYTAVKIQWWTVTPIELWPLASVFVQGRANGWYFTIFEHRQGASLWLATWSSFFTPPCVDVDQTALLRPQELFQCIELI